jgi:hypothetical protein
MLSEDKEWLDHVRKGTESSSSWSSITGAWNAN